MGLTLCLALGPTVTWCDDVSRGGVPSTSKGFLCPVCCHFFKKVAKNLPSAPQHTHPSMDANTDWMLLGRNFRESVGEETRLWYTG